MLDFKLWKTGAQQLRTQVADIKNRLEKARRRREDLETLPLPRADVAETLCQAVDRAAAAYVPSLRVRADFILRKPKITNEHLGLQQFNPLVVGFGDNKITPAALCFFFGDMIKEKMRQAVDQLDYPSDGPSRADRERELVELENVIADLEAKEKLVAQEIAALKQELG